MFIRCPSVWKRNTGAVPVYLNVYDLTSINGYAYWFGLGIYHSGIQVHGVEYAYGAHEHPATGIFEGEPRACPGFAFRKSILVGKTDLGEEEVRDLIAEIAEKYSGNTYNLISKNCNHFCNYLSQLLTGNAIPSWVNRLANLGFFCKCLLPVRVAAVKSRTEEGNSSCPNGDLKQLKNCSAQCGCHGIDGGKSLAIVLGRRSGSRRNRLESSSPSIGGSGIIS